MRHEARLHKTEIAVMTHDFAIQELIRILDATLWSVGNEKNGHSGYNAVKIIQFLAAWEGMEQYVSPELFQLMRDCKMAGENVRGPVKQILTYPRKGYAPWQETKVREDVLQEIAKTTEDIAFSLQIVHGKLYAVSEKSLPAVVYRILQDQQPDIVAGLSPNIEASHITLVNSNEVDRIGLDKVQDFVEQFAGKRITIRTGKIAWTFSEDWSRFGKCVVIKITSETLDEILTRFNTVFGTSLKPSPHVTFAIASRDLFAKFPTQRPIPL